MAKALSQAIQSQITNKRFDVKFIFKINGVDHSQYLKGWSTSHDKSFGSASATFIVDNAYGNFSDGEVNEVKVGDVVELIERFGGDTTDFKRFYGKVDQRSLSKVVGDRTLTLTCLDYISILRQLDIDLEVEGTKIEIENETLTPNYLSAPNDQFAQIFNFANNAIAEQPKPIFVIKDKFHLTEDPQYDGFDVYYNVGQVKFGAPINARDNHEVLAKSYYFYTKGVYAEDILEAILKEPDGYGKYLFNEASATDFVNNHLKTTFQDQEGAGQLDYLTPNVTSSTVEIRQLIVGAITEGQTTLVLDDIKGIPASGNAKVNGNEFTWTNLNEATKTLSGIPSTGTYSLKNHPNGSYVKYELEAEPGKLWYLTYSNVQDDLVDTNFTLPSSATSLNYDTTTSYTGGAGTSSRTFSHVIGSGLHRILIVFITTEDASPDFIATNVTYNSVGMHFLTSETTSDGFSRTEAWYLLENQLPAGGTYNVSINFTAGVTAAVIGATSFYNVKQDIPDYAQNSSVGSTAMTNNLSTAVDGSYIVDIITSGANSTFTPTSGQTERFDTTSASTMTTALSTRSIATAGTYAQSWSAPSANRLASIMVILEPFYNGSEVDYFDKRFGRIILRSAISVNSVVRCNYNYTFKTLQATGIELNRMAFRSRELESRFEAVQKLKTYLAPNYIIRTQGDDKIWSSYLSQKTTADYSLAAIENIQYLEDEDLYTRAVFYGKNKNPTNVMFEESVDFVTTGQSYRSVAGQVELQFDRTEEGWHVFKTLISDAGKIILDNVRPIVYINGIPIDNTLHQMIAQPVKIVQTTRTETTTESSKFGGTDVDVRVYYYYKILFTHQNIEPSQTIYLYSPTGVNILTISPHDGLMDYGRGIYYVPGDQENSTVATLSTATYWVMYSDRALQIDYDNVRFLINSAILPAPSEATISATFEYFTVFTPAHGIGAVIDGRWDTQVQTEFYSQPPSGYRYAIIDLGEVRTIQAMDLVAGFFKPDEIRKFDIDMRITLHSSLDNIEYREISAKTHNIQLTGGSSVSFDEKDLGIGFEARYILVILEYVKKIDYTDNGIYAVAFTEISVYEDLILKSEATLIATTATTTITVSADSTIDVVSTEGFEYPSSGATKTAYIEGVPFTYTDMTDTSFLGCTISSGVNEATGARVAQSLETSTTLYDDNGLRNQLGDRIYKDLRINDETLFTQDQLDGLAKSYLREFYKDHNKLSVNVLYAPYLMVGQTVSLTDTYNNQDAIRYFIERISDNNGHFSLVLARYPA